MLNNDEAKNEKKEKIETRPFGVSVTPEMAEEIQKAYHNYCIKNGDTKKKDFYLKIVEAGLKNIK